GLAAMKGKGRLGAGLLLVVVAVLGMLTMVRVLDRSEVWREVPAPRPGPGGATVAPSLRLGRLFVAAPGAVRAVVCPTPLVDPGPWPRPWVAPGRDRRPLVDRPWSWAVALLAYVGVWLAVTVLAALYVSATHDRAAIQARDLSAAALLARRGFFTSVILLTQN